MMINNERGRRSKFSWIGVARLGVSAIFLFWFYTIWNTTAGLNQKLNTATNRYSSIHNLQIEYKNEIQDWKNLLLRSNSHDILDKNWRAFETQYQKVATSTQDIIFQNDVRAINEPLKAFAEAHIANYEQYKKSVGVLTKNHFDPHPADAAVKGIDRPVLEYLAAAEVAMQDEKASINERLTANARNQIELSLLILTFIALLVVWMPKW